MEIITLKYQFVVFGSYDDITPNIENIKFFIDEFADKNLIPSQYKEISLQLSQTTLKNNDTSRLSLTSTDGRWNIRFNIERIDFFLTNSNIGKVQMPTIEDFLKEAVDILSRIHEKFPKKHKRIALVAHYIFKDFDATESSNKANNVIGFLKSKPVREWSSKTTVRTTVLDSEIINVINEYRWGKATLKINDANISTEGLLLLLDINTIPENQNYRFTHDSITPLLSEMSKVSEILKNENIEILK